ncbi:MAG: 5-formyltetrahydrofolate cyclo-ligase [Actinobacteria bacterium]|nr:5-formyltetrahydrofolate cyclo-ligase [Actinomycetota bacterium]
MDKGQQRTELIANRVMRLRAQSATQIQDRSDAVVAATLANAHIAQACEQARIVASYESFGTEPPTHELNDELRRMGATVIVPSYEDGNGARTDHLSWHVLTGDGIRAGCVAKSAAEFKQLACAAMLIPALAVARDGSRLGRGGGYYDRMLSAVPRHPGGPIRIAIVYADEVFDSLTREAHDEFVDDHLAIRID